MPPPLSMTIKSLCTLQAGTHFERPGRVIRVRRFLSFAKSFLATAFLIMFMPASGLGSVATGMEEILSSSASISCEISSAPFAVFLSRTPGWSLFVNSIPAVSNAARIASIVLDCAATCCEDHVARRHH
jgi:hypothetical protein